MNSQNAEPTRWWDLSAAVILFFAVFLAAQRLIATDWTDELDLIQTITFLGFLFGLALGQSLFNRSQVIWYGTGLGIVILGWQLGLLGGEGIEWSERMTSLGGRLLVSTQNLIQQRAVTDPILFVTLMSMLFWGLNVHAGYALTRHANAWRATLPLGLALFIIHIHDPFWPNRTWFIASFIFLSLILLSRTHFLRNRVMWKQNRTHLPPYVGLDFLRATMFVGGILVLLSWTAPALASSVPPIERAWQRLAEPWYEARSRMSNAFASLRATVGVSQDYYGDVLPLGRGNTLTDVVVFVVKAPPPPSTGVRYYWRDRVYDTWNGSSWTTSSSETRDLSPEEPAFPFANFAGRWESSFSFYPAFQSSAIHAPAQPQWISRPTVADIVSNPDSTIDIFSAKTSPPLRPGEVYEVQASLTNATQNQLRSAGTNYPDWIVSRYLQLPTTLSDRTQTLAQQIAEPFDNPYDIAEAVTQWMRTNITYNDTVPIPPSNQDIIDWLLFDQKSGFCNYYATTEIILLRLLGIPARMAVGYAQGELDVETDLFTVRQRDAHAWVEVYFPGIGWAEFEPTLNQRPLRRPVGDPINADGTNNINPSNQNPLNLEELLGFERIEDQAVPEELINLPERGFFASPLGVLTLAGAGILVLAIVGIAWYRNRITPEKLSAPSTPPLAVKLESTIRRYGLKPPKILRRWAYHASLPLQARAYQVMNTSLTRLGSPPLPNNTPSERASTLKVLLPTANEPIQSLLHEYQSLMYGTNGSGPDWNSAYSAHLAAQSIRNRTWIAIGQRLLARFQTPKRKDTIIDWRQ